MSGPTEQVTLARVALHRLGLVGKGMERDRRPTQDELDRTIAFCDGNQRQSIPVGRLVKFAVATAMRQEEICTLMWSDVDLNAQLAVIRNRKDPRRKNGNDQRIPLIDATGYDPIALLKEQRTAVPTCDRVFPHNGRSLDIPEVCLMTGHKDWKMLRRYLNLRPHQLVGRTPRPRTYSPHS
jgi:integrase